MFDKRERMQLIALLVYGAILIVGGIVVVLRFIRGRF